MGSSREYTASEVVEAIEAEDGVVRDVAERLGCSRMTVYRYRDRYKTVAEALEKNRTDLVFEMRDRLKDLARDPEVTDSVRRDAIQKLLEVFDDEIDWSDRQRTEHTGEMDIKGVDFSPPDADS
jgi:AcrR family transcriptional regulator